MPRRVDQELASSTGFPQLGREMKKGLGLDPRPLATGRIPGNLRSALFVGLGHQRRSERAGVLG